MEIPSEISNSTDQLPMDLAVALPHFSNDREFFDEMCHDFKEHMSGRLDQFDHALKAEDAASLSHAAHSLKGVSATFGAVPLAAVCADLELLASQGDLSDAQALVGRIQAEAGRLLAYMESDLHLEEKEHDEAARG
jgi:HPt (histidine-containing phosphotransfer) domain-containing protein